MFTVTCYILFYVVFLVITAVQQGRLSTFPLLYHSYFGLSNFLTTNSLPPIHHHMIGSNITQLINMLLVAEHHSYQYLNNEQFMYYLNFVLNKSKTRTELQKCNQHNKSFDMFNLTTYNDISSNNDSNNNNHSLIDSSSITSTIKGVGKSLSREEQSFMTNMKCNQQSTILNEITNSTMNYLLVMIEWAKNISLFTDLQVSTILRTVYFVYF